MGHNLYLTLMSQLTHIRCVNTNHLSGESDEKANEFQAVEVNVPEGLQPSAQEEPSEPDQLLAAWRHPAVMACYHPSKIKIQRKLAGELGRWDDQMVRCGSCLGCRSDQAREWAIRLTHEAQTHEHAWFITLTYDEESIPQFGSLDPRDPTLFLKRLRRKYKGRRLSYYLCGEYGERTQRPHYHAVLCGAPLLDRDRLPNRNGSASWVSDTLATTWTHGLHEFTNVSYAAAAYVAGYVRKKVRARHDRTRYTRVDPSTGEIVELQPEYSRMSRRPAIGRRFIERYWRDVYPRDFVTMDGREFNPPGYYDRFMDLEDSKGGTAERRMIMEEVRYQRFKDRTEIPDEKLIMKEKIHRARVALFQKREL